MTRRATAWAFALFGIGGLLLPCALLYTWFTRSDSMSSAPTDRGDK